MAEPLARPLGRLSLAESRQDTGGVCRAGRDDNDAARVSLRLTAALHHDPRDLSTARARLELRDPRVGDERDVRVFQGGAHAHGFRVGLTVDETRITVTGIISIGGRRHRLIGGGTCPFNVNLTVPIHRLRDERRYR